MKNVLIAPNSFKGCADSIEVAELFYKHLSTNLNLNCELYPISDGGDGFLHVCKNLYGLELKSFSISTPCDNSQIEVRVGYDKESQTIYIESALVLGLILIPIQKRKVIKLSSKGMGELLNSLIEENQSGNLPIKKIIVGIGGTGTNDLGLGMCSRFGLELKDHFKKLVEIIPGEFHTVSELKWEPVQLPFEIECILDVDNDVLGKSGSTYQFASQKGATKGELAVMELGFTKIINLLYNNKIHDRAKKLYGAGGGLAAGFQIFLNAEFKHSRDFILDNIQNKFKTKSFDILITGEGSFDKQSLSGKGAGTLINYFSNKLDKIYLCSGKIDPTIRESLPSNVRTIQLKDFFESEEESIQSFELGIEKVCSVILKEIDS